MAGKKERLKNLTETLPGRNGGASSKAADPPRGHAACQRRAVDLNSYLGQHIPVYERADAWLGGSTLALSALLTSDTVPDILYY